MTQISQNHRPARVRHVAPQPVRAALRPPPPPRLFRRLFRRPAWRLSWPGSWPQSWTIALSLSRSTLALHLAQLRRTWRAFTQELPPDVREEEVTEIVLFKLSVALNRALGGEADMTFSARCHHCHLHKRRGWQGLLWTALCRAIDLGCALLRYECGHCECAWRNHQARGD